MENKGNSDVVEKLKQSLILLLEDFDSTTSESGKYEISNLFIDLSNVYRNLTKDEASTDEIKGLK